MNGYQAALTAVVPDRVPAWRRGVASALAGLGLPVGGVIGTVLAASQADHISRGYLLLGVVIVLAAVLFATAAREPAVGPADVARPAPRLRAFVSCLADADFRWVFISRLLLVLGHFVVATYNLYILQDFVHLPAGISPTKAVALLSPVGAVSMIVAVVAGGVLSDRIGRRKPFVFASSAVAGLAGLIPLAWPTLPGIVVFAVVAGLAFGCFLAVDTSLATLVLPSGDDAGRDLGVLNLALAGPQIVAPLAASVIVAQFGGYPAVFITGAVLGVLGGVAILPVRRVR
jgi:MFS family permease